MMYIKLSDSALELELKTKVTQETAIQTQILHLLAEVERRRLYSKEVPSLFEYCVSVLKYSHSSAQRRIDTMRALKLMPEIEQKLQTGELNLTTVSLAQGFFRSESKLGKKLTLTDKQEIIKKIENKSAQETIKEFVKISPQAMVLEKRRDLTETQTELKVVLKTETLQKLDQLKALLSNKHGILKDSELIDILADICLDRLDPLKFKKRSKSSKFTALGVVNSSNLISTRIKETIHSPSSTSPRAVTSSNQILSAKAAVPQPVSNISTLEETESSSKLQTQLKPKKSTQILDSRYIPMPIKRQIWQRDNSCCSYIHPKTLKRCNSKYFLQIDHIQPHALNGSKDPNNLRLVCQAHNLRYALNTFGDSKINSFMRTSSNKS